MDTHEINFSIMNQMLASLYMLKNCIVSCPEKEWNEKHNDYGYSQVIFHVLYDCDYSLCDFEDEFKKQKVHINNAIMFDYSELENGIPKIECKKSFIDEYYDHCIRKVKKKIEGKGFEEISQNKSDVTRLISKIERYINSIRHIQHHAAQLGLRLQFITGKEMEWIGRVDSSKIVN